VDQPLLRARETRLRMALAELDVPPAVLDVGVLLGDRVVAHQVVENRHRAG